MIILVFRFLRGTVYGVLEILLDERSDSDLQ